MKVTNSEDIGDQVGNILEGDSFIRRSLNSTNGCFELGCDLVDNGSNGRSGRGILSERS